MKKKAFSLFVCLLIAALTVTGALLTAPEAQAVTLYREGDNMLADGGREYTGTFAAIDVQNVLQGYTGRHVTLSFDLRGKAGQTVRIYAYQSSGISIASLDSSPMAVTISKDDVYTRYSLTVQVKNYGQQYGSRGEALSAGAIAFFDGAAEKQAFSVRQVKIELGDQATAWSANPNDPLLGVNMLSGSGQAKVTQSRFVMYDTKDSLKAYVGCPVTVSFDVRSSNAGELRVYGYQSSGVTIGSGATFSVKAGGYQRFSFQTAVTDLGQQYDGSGKPLSAGSLGFYDASNTLGGFTVRNVKIELGSAATAWSFAPQDPLDGANLMLDSARERTSQNGFLQIPSKEMLSAYNGSEITISFDAKSSSPSSIQVYGYQKSGMSIEAQSGVNMRFSPTDSYRRYSFTVDVRDYGVQYNGDRALSAGAIALYNQSGDHSDFSIRRIKIEVGARASAWNLAANDPTRVSSVAEALSYLQSCRANRVTNFILYPDESTYQALAANQFYAFRRLLAQAGYSLGASIQYTVNQSIAVNSAELATTDCFTVSTRSELIALYRNAAKKNLKEFNVVMSESLFNTLCGSGWSPLYQAEVEGAVASSHFYTYSAYHVLCYDDFLGIADAPYLTTVADAVAYMRRVVPSMPSTIYLFCSPALKDTLRSPAVINGREATWWRMEDLFYNNGLFHWSSSSSSEGRITVTNVEYTPGFRIITMLNAGRESSLSSIDRQTLSAARSLIAGVDKSSVPAAAQGIEAELARRVTYTIDERTENDDCAIGALLYGQANCDGYADAFYLCGSLAGLNVHLQHGAALHPQSSADETHLWNLVFYKNAWTMLDATWDDNDGDSFTDTIYSIIGKDRASLVYLWDPAFTLEIAATTDLKRGSVPEYLCNSQNDINAAAKDAAQKRIGAFYLLDGANGRLITGNESFQQAMHNNGISGYTYTWYDDLPYWRIYNFR